MGLKQDRGPDGPETVQGQMGLKQYRDRWGWNRAEGQMGPKQYRARWAWNSTGPDGAETGQRARWARNSTGSDGPETVQGQMGLKQFRDRWAWNSTGPDGPETGQRARWAWDSTGPDGPETVQGEMGPETVVRHNVLTLPVPDEAANCLLSYRSLINPVWGCGDSRIPWWCSDGRPPEPARSSAQPAADTRGPTTHDTHTVVRQPHGKHSRYTGASTVAVFNRVTQNSINSQIQSQLEDDEKTSACRC